MFPKEEALKAEKKCTLWKSIYKHAADKLDYLECDGDVGYYNSTKELLVDYSDMEEEGPN